MPEGESFHPVVLAPTYNNAATLLDILQRVLDLGLPLIVIDDGCTDSSAELLREFIARSGHGQVQVVTHPRNRGKAAALRTGFAAASAAGYTHAATIDTDGQLDPEQIPEMLAAAQNSPRALILGCRVAPTGDYPRRSQIGRMVSNHLVWTESGARVGDSQCGLRVYPLGLMNAVPCRAQHYGFETEILSRAGWAGCPVIEVPVRCRYLPLEVRVSHFRPWLDSIRAFGMHLRLLARALTPWPHRRWPGPVTVRPWRARLRQFLHWLSPVEAWRQLRAGRISRLELASSLAVGVFIANLPLYGVQTLASLYAARRLHLSPIAVVAGSQASIPPIGALLIAAAVCVGHFLLHGALPPLASYGSSLVALAEAAPALLLDWVIGSLVVGAFLATATFALVMAFAWQPVSSGS